MDPAVRSERVAQFLPVGNQFVVDEHVYVFAERALFVDEIRLDAWVALLQVVDQVGHTIAFRPALVRNA